MTGKRLLKRLVTVLLGMLGLFVFLHAVDADAMTKAVSLSAVGHQHPANFHGSLPVQASFTAVGQRRKLSLRPRLVPNQTFLVLFVSCTALADA